MLYNPKTYKYNPTVKTEVIEGEWIIIEPFHHILHFVKKNDSYHSLCKAKLREYVYAVPEKFSICLQCERMLIDLHPRYKTILESVETPDLVAN